MNEARLLMHEQARKKERARQRREVLKIRMMGLVMIAISVAFIAITWGTYEDASGAIVIGIFGLYCTFGRMRGGRSW